MNEVQISTLGLLLAMAPGILHSVEVAFPMLSRLIVNYVLPLFGLTLPNSAKSLSYDEQIKMLDAAKDVAPKGKQVAATDYLFLMIFEQRQGSLAFLSVVVAIIYAISLPLADRAVLHLLMAVMSVLFALVNANHGGIPLLGHHPKISKHGRNVGIVFAPFWAVAAILNGLAFANTLG